MVFSWPTLSDDFARFLWDGYLVLQGISPYAFTPDTLLAKEGIAEAPFLSALHPLLNSSGYYSIYPPVNQLFFALSVYVGQSDFFHALVFLRIVLIAAEGLVFFVMHKMLLSQGLSPKKTLLYALNPLVILEIAGNLHFEGLMLLAVLGTFWLFRRRSVWSGCCFGLAIAIKLTPLLLAPMLLAKSRSFSDLGKFTLGLFLMLVCCLLPIYPFQDNFFTSFSLYYGKFEFNASIYYLIREIFMFWIDYNPIQYVTPLLSIISATAILWLAIQSRIHLNIYQLSVLSYVCYLMLHAVVHPWYIILPLGLSVFTKLQTMQVWSAFIFLSYVAYRSVPVLESPWVILVQYVAVLFFFYRDIQNFNTAQTIP
ncbi:glycosyltransferase 87 family protein [Lunatimonas sp.]|uniref:glycosyltransferase 87 family protein n=1 Tax=Lunatimonas sp. TaxID=2060141 RepID=UPI00263AEE50|nr:glycosyltransferase 87 family protein [Lunatimonas sp.]